MAEEERLSGLLAGDSPEDAGVEDFAPAAIDPAAAALAMNAARADATLAAKAGAYFERQAQLVGLQAEHLHEQREVQLSHLKLKRLSERLKVGAQIFIVVAATLLGATMTIMLHDAITSRTVIVEPFDAPPALATRGLTGKVMANALLDQLTRLQALAQKSSVSARDLSDSWTGDIKVEVPATGISFNDLQRLLKDRFGHDLRIGGDLIQTEAGGLALTVRGGGITPKTFAGGAGDLNRLTLQAGEYVYGQTQPALFAIYLARAGRNAEAIGFSRAAVPSAPPEERAYILNAWAIALGNTGGSAQESLTLERAAMALKPDYWTAYTNASLYARDLGDEEAAWRAGEAMRKAAGGRPGRAPEIAYTNWDWLTGNFLADRAALLADAEQNQGVGSTSTAANPEVAGVDIDLHDFEDARLRLQTFDLTDAYAATMAHYVRGRMAQDANDTATGYSELLAYGMANADPTISQGDTSYHCDIAPAAEAAGHPDRADAELKAGGHFVNCARYRGDILDRRGEWAAAQRAYAAAVAMAPDLPFAYYSWAAALLRHGDPAGAIEKLRQANRRGPHWADPLKLWGDALALEKRNPAEKYDEALRYAPAWPELRQVRNSAQPNLE